MFVALGDSITEFGTNGGFGWLDLMAQHYSRKADVINRGLSGWNTRWALEVLPHTLADLVPADEAGNHTADGKPWSPRVQLLIIWFGANDAVGPGRDAYMAVPLEEYKANLAAMVKAARDAGVPHILLLTPSPVDEAKWAKWRGIPVTDRLNAQVRQYAQATLSVGVDLNVSTINLYSMVSGLPSKERESFSSDGLHPSQQGQQLIWRWISDAIDLWPALEGVRRDRLPMHYPSFKEINATNPNATFTRLFADQLVVPEDPQGGAGR